jgi:tRNA A37 N6-isopentenylltransferase MiaA
MQHAQTQPKVLFVMGSTGVGKSDLAIQIAVELGTKYSIKAEIINADAMQVYCTT